MRFVLVGLWTVSMEPSARLMTELATACVRAFDLDLQRIHNDSTTIRVLHPKTRLSDPLDLLQRQTPARAAKS
jgi:hypothetical protein